MRPRNGWIDNGLIYDTINFEYYKKGLLHIDFVQQPLFIST